MRLSLSLILSIAALAASAVMLKPVADRVAGSLARSAAIVENPVLARGS